MVKAILFGKDVDAFEGRLGHGDVSVTTEHELWRKKGPVGKLQNLVVAIRRSDVLTTLSPQCPTAGVRCIGGP